MRIGFGATALLTLGLHFPHLSYSFGAASRWGVALQQASSVHEFSWPITSIFSAADSDLVLYLKVGVLSFVAAAYTIGWRTRIVAPLFLILWLSFATLNPVIANTGHYQTFRVMLIYLIFADSSRRWSLDARRRMRERPRQASAARRARLDEHWIGNLFNNAAVVLIAFQVCVIYVTSALWKLQGATWMSGVAVYYPLQLEELRLFPWMNDLVSSVTPLVYAATWLTVAVQLLAPILLLNRVAHLPTVAVLSLMHIGIGVLLALPFFSAVMICADAIFVRESSWGRVIGWARRLKRSAGSISTQGVLRSSTSNAPTPLRRGTRSSRRDCSPKLKSKRLQDTQSPVATRTQLMRAADDNEGGSRSLNS